MDTQSLEVIQSFVAKLLERHREIQNHEDEDQSLVYANSLLTYWLRRKNHTDLPPQIVVIGPTQAGKSTITNLLLGGQVAEASPLAGYTRHASGYFTDPTDDKIETACDILLPGLNRSLRRELSNDKLDCFALQYKPGTLPIRKPLMVWDTPDFDSFSSRSYRSTVPKLCAIADLIVLVVSKDKYADQTVWEMLKLIGQIKRPMLVCINKTPSTNQAEIRAVVEKKFLEEHIAVSGITTLPILTEDNFSAWLKQPETEQFRKLADASLIPDAGLQDVTQLKQFLQRHWGSWASSVNEERAARQQWEEIVNATLKETSAAYERDYLRNPNYGDTIQRAVVRLLELLELPGIAAGLARARETISWPARKIISYFKKPTTNSNENVTTDHETQALNDALAHLLLQLQRAAGEQAANTPDNTRLWWQQLWQYTQSQSTALTESGKKSIKAHQLNFEPHIEDSAQQLFQHLQEHPTTLNGLRAARISTDAAAVVIALKTGGIGLNDLVLAPAMLSFSTMLAEGAVGRYMKTIEEKLKVIQLESMNEHVLSPMQQQLISMPTQMNTSGLYGLSPDELDKTNKALEELTP
jgi:GTP-binding protein EngB required for normal cell division